VNNLTNDQVKIRDSDVGELEYPISMLNGVTVYERPLSTKKILDIFPPKTMSNTYSIVNQ